MADPLLARVVVAISAFRSDVQVLALLAKIFDGGRDDLAGVIVVDSLSDGTLAKSIGAAGWPVRYENAAVNLGSAGNLQRRLELAATLEADWCFAINHDGMFDRALIGTLAAMAQRRDKVGAIYPRRIWLDRGGTSGRPHTHVFNMPTHGGADERLATDEVAWDSSNGALYGLAPVRRGVRVWGDLWYNWEDLAYGWQLADAGWKQYFCTQAVYLDDYEYQRVLLFGRPFYMTRKPPWATYYIIRNLVLIVRRTGGGRRAWTFFAKRLAREIALAGLFRNAKLARLGFIGRGLADGLAARTGKGRHP